MMDLTGDHVMTFDPESFRRAMRAWTTGVAALMAWHENEVYGITVNSFTSLSLDPPLVTVALKSDTRVFELVTKSRAFSVIILSAEQQELAANFAGKLHGAERMAGLASLLDGGLARLDCRVVHTYAAGENTLIVAEISEAHVHSTENPLVYHNREYHQLA
jgi:flavin reductase (DIM6/NTAB) family NADH-FMN oxidoreductase RutF